MNQRPLYSFQSDTYLVCTINHHLVENECAKSAKFGKSWFTLRTERSSLCARYGRQPTRYAACDHPYLDPCRKKPVMLNVGPINSSALGFAPALLPEGAPVPSCPPLCTRTPACSFLGVYVDGCRIGDLQCKTHMDSCNNRGAPIYTCMRLLI